MLGQGPCLLRGRLALEPAAHGSCLEPPVDALQDLSGEAKFQVVVGKPNCQLLDLRREPANAAGHEELATADPEKRVELTAGQSAEPAEPACSR